MAFLPARRGLLAAVLVLVLLPAVGPVGAQTGTVTVYAFDCPPTVDPNGSNAAFAVACAIPADGLTFALTVNEITRRRTTAAGAPASWPSVSGPHTLRLESLSPGTSVVFCDAGNGPERQSVADSAIALSEVPAAGVNCTWFLIPPVATSSPAPSPTAAPSPSPMPSVTPNPTPATPACATSTGAAAELPQELAVGADCYMFDRLVPLDPATLVEVADSPVRLYAKSPPDGVVYAVPIPEVPGQLARYLPEQLATPDRRCPFEMTESIDPSAPLGGLEIPLDGQTVLHYAFAGIELDLSPRFLPTTISSPDNPFPVIAEGGPAPQPEVFVPTDSRLLRFVLLDEQGLPVHLSSPLAFAGQSFSYVVTADQPQTLGRVGCAGPFPILAVPGQMASPFSRLYAQVGSRVFTFEAGVATTTAQPAATGSLVITKRDPSGNLLAGACFTVDNGAEVCDNGEGDADPAEGVIQIDNLAPGDPVLREVRAPSGFEPRRRLRRVTIVAGEVATIDLVNNPVAAPTETGLPTGAIAATTIDENGNELPEVCYDLTDFGQQCDGDDEDTVMTQEDVPPGEYTVTVQVPNGYEVVGDVSNQVTVEAGQTAQVRFQVQRPAAGSPVPVGSPAAGCPALGSEWAAALRWLPEVEAAVELVRADLERQGEEPVLVPVDVVLAVIRIETQGVMPDGPGPDGGVGLLNITAMTIGANRYDLVRAAVDPAYSIYIGTYELALRYLDSGKLPWRNVVVGFFAGHYEPTGASDASSSDYQYQALFDEYVGELEACAAGAARTPVAGAAVPDNWLAGQGQPIDGLAHLWGGVEAFLTQEFGPSDFTRANPEFFAYSLEYGFPEPGHTGLDVGIPAGTPLYAPSDAVVVCAGTDNGNGEDSCASFQSSTGGPTSGRLQLGLRNGDMLIFGHVKDSVVKPGEPVVRGQLIGHSGTQNGDHVYVEYRIPDPSTGAGWHVVDPRLTFLNTVPGAEQGTPVSDVRSAPPRTGVMAVATVDQSDNLVHGVCSVFAELSMGFCADTVLITGGLMMSRYSVSVVWLSNPIPW